MAAALPGAFGERRRAVRDQLRRAAGRAQRRGREPAAAATIRCATCSSGSSAGAPRRACCGWRARRSHGDRRLLLWIPAVALDLCAPVAGYWLPRRGRAVTTDYDIEGGHFTDRCQGFIIIALGESIVVTGATAADAGLTSDGRPLPRPRVPRDRRAVVAVLRRGRRALAPGDEHLRGPGPAGARRLHLPARPDRGRDHRRRGRRRPADRRARARAARRRPGDGARRPGALPARREPLPAARDRRGQRQAPRRRGDPRAAGADRLADQRAGAERDRGRAAERARAVGAADAGGPRPRDTTGGADGCARWAHGRSSHLQQQPEGTS